MMVIVLDTFVVFPECQVLFEALYIYYQVRQSEKASLSQRGQIMLPSHTCFLVFDFKPEK